MLNVMVDVKVVDAGGDITWTQIKIMPSDDPTEDYIDVSLMECTLREGENHMLDPVELRRALDVVAGERAKFLTPEENLRV